MTLVGYFQDDIFHNHLRSFISNRLKDKNAADDLLHDVFLKASENANQLRDHDRAKAWIYQIARNTIIDHYRNKLKPLLSAGDDAQSDFNYNECAARNLKELVRLLPEKYRIPFQLAEIDKVSQTELTHRLDLSYSGVKSRVQRARKMLRELLIQKLVIETDAYGNIIVCNSRVA
jgi:RNA polymerase sigma-70 factor, ECF subfamily